MGKNRLAVICDFDGTVAKTDVGHSIYTRFGDERWEEINKRWRRGEMSSKDCLIGEYSLIDASEQEVKEYVSEMEIDPGFIDLVATCRDNDIPIAVASDGFDFYIHVLLEKYGISDIEVFCNGMEFNGRKVELSFPFYDQGCGVCGNCKKLHVQRFKDDSKKVIYVGDGLSDRFAARASDVVFAKDELMEYLMKNDADFIKFADLSEVNRWMVGMLAGDIDLPPSSNGADPCQEVVSFKKDDTGRKKENTPKKRKMKKRLEDMGDGRYIVYYDFELNR
jgi:2-hydroxy-3-keto-5-methylthiopentenyl-1-phosphate phosphatase